MKQILAKKLSLIIVGIGIGILFSQLYNSWPSVVSELCGRQWRHKHGNGYQCDTSSGIPIQQHQGRLKQSSHGTPRLLCWVLTSPRNHEKRAQYVKQTWGKRCHILIFISTKYDETLPTVPLVNITEGRVNLWAKTRDAFRYVYRHYLDSADFFLKADDDTYVIVENLLHLLRPYDPNSLVYLGCEFKGYMSGGAGYVLSRAAVELLVTKGLSNPQICKQGDDGVEDAELGSCLRKLNVTMGDSRDEIGKHRFLPLRPIDHVNKGRIDKFRYNWFWDYMKYRPEDGQNCCSRYPVSFHYIEGEELMALDHLIYNVQVRLEIQSERIDGK